MKKYLLWLICFFRGHLWAEREVGRIPDHIGILCERFRCQRCNMYRFVKIESNSLFP